MSYISVVSSGGSSGTVTSISAATGITLTPNPITSTGTVGLTIPVVVTSGGTGLITATTAYAPICAGTTATGAFQVASTGLGTSGFVLTSTGASSLPSFQAPASGVVTINGDSGSATGSTISFISQPFSGKSVSFVASGSTVDLSLMNQATGSFYIGNPSGNTSSTTALRNVCIGGNTMTLVTDAIDCVTIGSSAHAAALTSANCIAIGSNALTLSSDSSDCIAIGVDAMNSALSAAGCICIGTQAGSALTNNETYNIYIGEQVVGVAGENNTLRLGTLTGTDPGQLAKSFIAGIAGITVANALPVVIDTTTGQLGTASSSTVLPAFSAWPSADQINVTGDATLYTVTFDTADFNYGNHYNTGTSTFTAPSSGIYLFSARINVYNLGVTHTDMSFRLDVNGSAPVYAFSNINPFVSQSATNGLTLNGNVIVKLNASDACTIKIQVIGGTKTVDITGTDNTYTAFSGYKLI